MRSSPPWSPGRATSSPRTSPLPSRAGRSSPSPCRRTAPASTSWCGAATTTASSPLPISRGGRSRSGCDRRSGTSCSARAATIRTSRSGSSPRTRRRGPCWRGSPRVGSTWAAVDVDDAGRVEEEWPALRVVPRPFEGDAVAWGGPPGGAEPARSPQPVPLRRAARASGADRAARRPARDPAPRGAARHHPQQRGDFLPVARASRWASSTSCCASSQGDSSACTSR